MSLFADNPPAANLTGVTAPASAKAGERRPRGRRVVGWALLCGALLGTFAFALIPAPYVIEEPGPVFNTLGSAPFDNGTRPLIQIPSQKTYPTAGALDLLTVDIIGGPENSASWLQIARAWLDPSKAVVPVENIFQPGVTEKQSEAEDAADMANSKSAAVAAALKSLGYTLPQTLTVGALTPNSPSEGLLKVGDSILSVNNEALSDTADIRSILAKAVPGKSVSIQILRAGKPQEVTVLPVLSDEVTPAPVIGIYPGVHYAFPFAVKIQLQNVGGPSAGQMFALGIIDKLTPGLLNGGAKVAGTGTIDGDGNIGAIGGIRQKLYGAKKAGAAWFLAPYSNCNEVTGHIPEGLTVFAVKTLKDSLAALTAIRTKAQTSDLLTCPAK